MTLYFRRGWRAAGLTSAAALFGVAASYAWQRGLWGLLTGASLAAIWLCGLAWWNAARVPSPEPPMSEDEGNEETVLLQSLLLDAAPVPLLALEGRTARALNRAARGVFGTEDRIVPVPAALLKAGAPYLRHEGRAWRIDRVTAPGGTEVAALIDVEREERAAEARASAELIEVLGHELLNGLAPIVSLAESAQNAAARDPADTAMLAEILGPLARRAEGLQRFAAAYRELARLPEPSPVPVPIAQFTADCARAFLERWPSITLTVDGGMDGDWPMDHDQMHQAVWALLANAADAAGGGPAAHVALSIRREVGRLAIIVTDSGAGVPQESAAHIFRPFHTTKPDGSGVGLSLARRIAHAHGGTLELVGARPTRFRLTLPS